MKTDKFKITIFFLLLVIIPAIMYASFLSHYYSGDDLQYVTVIDRSVTGQIFYHPTGSPSYQPELIDSPNENSLIIPVNPRYLLEFPTSILVFKLWRFLGWTGSPITPILVFRIIVGCLGLLFIARAIYELTENRLLTLLGSYGIAFSLSYWTYSTHLDQSINMIMIIGLVIFILMRQYRKDGQFNPKNVLIPVLMVIATLYNFTAIIISLVISFVIVLSNRQLLWKQRIGYFIRYNAIYAAILIFTLFSSIAILDGPGNLLDKSYWASATFAGHPEYDVNILKDFARAIIGFIKGQVTYPGSAGAYQNFWDQANSLEQTKLIVFFGFFALLFLAPLFYIAGKWLSRNYSKQMNFGYQYVVLIGIFIAYFVFNWFWDPGYIKYWIIPIICWWMITVGVVSEIIKRKEVIAKLSLFTVGTLVFVSLISNLTGAVISESWFSPNPWITIANDLKESPKNALFISNGSKLDFYISYFTRRDIISLNLLDYKTGGNADFTNKILAEKINSHFEDEGEIYIYSFSAQDEQLKDRILEIAKSSHYSTVWEFPDLTIDQVVK